jgi:uncharacterized protein (DUF1697 family)
MAELREAVSSLGHADVTTYIQSGNVLFTPQPADGSEPGRADAAALSAELEQAIAEGIGMQAGVVVLSRVELAHAVRDNPYPGETDPRLLHAIFLPDVPGPSLAAWMADAERQVQKSGSRDEARLAGRTVYLHTPDGYPRSEPRRALCPGQSQVPALGIASLPANLVAGGLQQVRNIPGHGPAHCPST